MAARKTILPNAFADILEAAADSPGASSASDAASHSVNVAPPPKRSDVAPPPPAPKPSDAAPPPKRDDVAPPPPPPERGGGGGWLGSVEALSLENERLRREAGAAAPRSAASKPARSRSCDEDGEAAPRGGASVGAAGRYSVDAALAGRRTSLSLPEPRAGGAAARPFVAVAIYGAEAAAPSATASDYGRYAVAPAELFAECAPGYEATAAALGAFACPDGAPLVAAAPAAALAASAPGAPDFVLRSDGAAALYLSCVTVVSLERVARPGAVRRVLDLAAAQMLCSFIHERRDADARAGAA
ncbi:hypothetical protein JL722_10152 [Aureococcus anophagefferens]|nr:hypothetical protein JL722_10152 [Aureococcus anophagefferens]